MTNNNSHLEFNKVSSNLIYDGYRKILEKKFLDPDGTQHGFEIIHTSHKIVLVVAFDIDQNLILIKQYRPGPEEILIEIPAGKVEEGEESIEGAKRELLEETGYTTENISLVGSFYSGAYSDGVFEVFLAKNCTKTQIQDLDDSEFIEVLNWSPEEFESYFTSQPTNGQCLLGYFLAKRYF